MMKTNFSTVIIAMLSAFILLTSCNNDDGIHACQCHVTVLPDTYGMYKFRRPQPCRRQRICENVTIEGNSSHSTIKFDVQTVNGRKYLAFDADLPDQKAMEWNSGRSEATGISKVTVRFNKQKTELRCMMKLKANRPPVTTGGSIVLEEVSCNNRSYRQPAQT